MNCPISQSCFKCPLADCVYEDRPLAKPHERLKHRRRTFYILNRRLGIPAWVIAAIWGLNMWTVYRDVYIASDFMDD